MADYICREAILDDLKKEIEAGNVTLDEDVWVNKGLRIAIRDVKDIKAADVQPVKHGEWKKKFLSDTICCSECKVTWSSSFKDMLNGFNYCPNCGARMIKDGEQNENN